MRRRSIAGLHASVLFLENPVADSSRVVPVQTVPTVSEPPPPGLLQTTAPPNNADSITQPDPELVSVLKSLQTKSGKRDKKMKLGDLSDDVRVAQISTLAKFPRVARYVTLGDLRAAIPELIRPTRPISGHDANGSPTSASTLSDVVTSPSESVEQFASDDHGDSPTAAEATALVPASPETDPSTIVPVTDAMSAEEHAAAFRRECKANREQATVLSQLFGLVVRDE
jgi:hypothetical protein